MSHLGRWLSALVDGELDGEERDRVLNHVAGCEGCRQEANAMRALKRRLTALGETSAEPAIASRLIDLALTSEPGQHAVDVEAACASGSSHAIGPAVRVLAASAGTVLAAIGTIAFLLGSTGSRPAPKVTPSVDSYLMQHAYDAGQAPAGSAQPTVPAQAYHHGARVAGPATGLASGDTASSGTASSGTASRGSTSRGTASRGTASGGTATSGTASSGTATSPKTASSRRSPTPLVSQHAG